MDREIPRLDPLDTAETLPSWLYTEPRIFALEQQRIFERTWQWFCRGDQVSGPGAFVSGQVGREPVVVVRGSDDVLHALSNVCRHRAGPVATGTGCAKAFRCGYHGWVYRLNGELHHAPEFDGAKDFRLADHGLPRFAVEEWEGHVFVNLAPDPAPLREHLGVLVDWAARYRLGALRFEFRDSHELACNWKTYIDNSQEGYHVRAVHPLLLRELDMKSYRQECAGAVTRQIVPPRPGSKDIALFRKMSPAQATLEGDEREISQFINVFPNWVVNLHPDHVVTELLVPVDTNRTVIHLDYWFPESPPRPRLARAMRALVATGITDGTASGETETRVDAWLRNLGDWAAGTRFYQQVLGAEIAKALNSHYTRLTQLEDNAITATVQRHMAAPSYERGRFSVARENAVHHFQTMVSRYLRGD